jgi:hypothetical protein
MNHQEAAWVIVAVCVALSAAAIFMALECALLR